MGQRLHRLPSAALGLLLVWALSLPASQDPYSVGKTVVFIQARDTREEVITGTGFLLANAQAVCLITVQHLARHTTKDSLVTLLSGDTPITLKLGDISATSPPAWVLHEKADIAALRLRPREDSALHVFRRAQILSTEPVPARERPVIVFGFPLRLGASNFSPVPQQFSRATNIEIATSDEFPIPAEYYFLDRPSVDGYSGAPVFHVPGSFTRGAGIVFRRDFALVGVVAGTLSDKTGGKLGAVVPPKFVAEAFDQAAASR
jgi:hypothetical protein